MLHTDRLLLRPMQPADAPFILRLLNEPAFLRFIGDRGVRTVEDAETYITQGPQQSQLDTGLGLLLVETKTDSTPLGMCGIMKKPWLDHPDIAYAFVPEAGGLGYAIEAARAVLEFSQDVLGLDRIVAVVTPDNASSIRLLAKLTFQRQGNVTDTRTGTELNLYAITRKGA